MAPPYYGSCGSLMRRVSTLLPAIEVVKVLLREVREHRVEGRPVAPRHRPLVRRRVVPPVALRYDALEVLQRQPVEREVDDVAPLVRAHPEVRQPRPAVVRGLSPREPAGLTLDVALR